MQRADGKAQTSISLRKDLLDQAKDQATAEGRSLSNWIEQILRDKFPDTGNPSPSSGREKKRRL